jgi:tetratricopeptide (TPR) repeat protein
MVKLFKKNKVFCVAGKKQFTLGQHVVAHFLTIYLFNKIAHKLTMLRLLLVNTCLLLTQFAFAQLTLKGSIHLPTAESSIYNQLKINCFGGNDTARADALDGTFELKLPLLKTAEDVFVLQIAANGYAPADAAALCIPTAEAVGRLHRLYYTPKNYIISLKTAYESTLYKQIDDTYRQRMLFLEAKFDSLDRQGQAFQNALFQLAQYRQTARAQVTGYATTLAQANPADFSEPFRRAMQLFGNGKCDSALVFLQAQEKTGLSERAHGNSASEQLWRDLLVARLAVLQLDFHKAETFYEQMIFAGMRNTLIYKELADLLKAQNRLDKAGIYYRHIEQTAKNPVMKADAQLKLAVLNFDKNEYVDAQNYFQAALRIYRRLAESNAEVFSPSFINVQMDLGGFYLKQNLYAKADSVYSEIIDLAMERVKNDSNTYAPILASVYEQKGNLYLLQNETYQDETAYLKALKWHQIAVKFQKGVENKNLSGIYTKLSKRYLAKSDYVNANLYLKKADEAIEKSDDIALKAVIQTLFGYLHQQQNELQLAEKRFTMAARSYQFLSRENPKQYDDSLAQNAYYQGVLFEQMNEYVKSEQFFLAALKIKQQLAEHLPKTYRPKMAAIYQHLGAVYMSSGDTLKSENAFNQAITIYNQLSTVESKNYYQDAALTQIQLGNAYYGNGNFAKAETVFLSAIETHKKSAVLQGDPAWLQEQANTHYKLGNVYKALNEYLKAESAFTESLDLLRKAGGDINVSHQLRIAQTEQNLGFLHQAKKDFENAKKSYSKSFDLFSKLSGQDTTLYFPEKAALQASLGEMNTYNAPKRDLSKSESYYWEALKMYKSLIIKQPQIYNEPLANVYQALGRLYRLKKEPFFAEKVLLESLVLREHAAASQSSTQLAALAYLKMDLSGIFSDKKDFVTAESYLNQAVEIFKSLSVTRPNYQNALINSQIQIIDLYVLSNDLKKAEALCEQGLAACKTAGVTSQAAMSGIYRRLGDISMAQNAAERAEQSYQTGLKMFRSLSNSKDFVSEIALIQIGLGKLATVKKQWNIAESAYSEAVLYLTDAPDTLVYALSEACMQASAIETELAKKMAYLQKAEQLQYSICKNGLKSEYCAEQYPKTALQLTILLLKSKKFADAEIVATRAASFTPKSAPLRMYMAHALLLQGKYEAAQKIYTELKDMMDSKGQPYRYSMLESLENLEFEGAFTTQPGGKIEQVIKSLK